MVHSICPVTGLEIAQESDGRLLRSDGYRPDGKGIDSETWGRAAPEEGETKGRAFTKDGKVRAKRVKLTTVEKAVKMEQERIDNARSFGRTIARHLPFLASFWAGVESFNAWIRDAREYDSPEKATEKAAYFQAMADAAQAKSEAAIAWLETAEPVLIAIRDFEAKLGEKALVYTAANNGEVPDTDTLQGFVDEALSEDARELVSGANDPDNDPYKGLRRADILAAWNGRNNATDDATDADADTL